MKWAVLLTLGFFGFSNATLLAQPRGPRGMDTAVKNGWLFNLDEGKAEARKTGKPLFVVVRCVP